jgi:hypothetical protein
VDVLWRQGFPSAIVCVVDDLATTKFTAQQAHRFDVYNTADETHKGIALVNAPLHSRDHGRHSEQPAEKTAP